MAKLITEEALDVNCFTESVDNKKKFYIEGIFLQADIVNKNGRVYPMPIMENAVKTYQKNFIDKNLAYGELDHRSSVSVVSEKISHRVISLKKEGKNFIGKALVSDTPCGKIVKTLINDGGSFGVSSRALGSIKEQSGKNVIQNDLLITTAADIVVNPSAPDAFIQGIMENVEYILNKDGHWIKQVLEDTKQIASNKSLSKRESEQYLEQQFSRFMKIIAERY